MENRQVIKVSPLFKNPPQFNKKKWRKRKKKRRECFEGSKEEFLIGEPSSAKADLHEWVLRRHLKKPPLYAKYHLRTSRT
ncbi:hypothetical protein OROGR_016455 [Orobanche gracilis]